MSRNISSIYRWPLISSGVKWLRTRIRDPKHRSNLSTGRELLEAGRVPQLIGFLSERISGTNLYVRALDVIHGGEAVRRRINGAILYLDLTDTGVSSQLPTRGTREVVSSAVFATELERLRTDVSGTITAIDVGANVGYYVMIEADRLGPEAAIHAIEPNPKAASLLERSVRVNGYDDRVSISRCAIGTESGRGELLLSKGSNWSQVEKNEHRSRQREDDGRRPSIRDLLFGDPRALHDSVLVRMLSGTEYMTEQEIDPESVHVLRMDLEGYETTVLQEFEEVLRAPGPLLLFVEVHPQLYDDDTIERLYSTFRDCGFDLVSAARNDRSLEVRTLREVEQADDWVELILRK